MKQLRNRQFILTQHPYDTDWGSVDVAAYQLYHHPNLELTISEKSGKRLLLLGYFFDYRQPEKSNQDILDTLVNQSTFTEVLEGLNPYAGQYVLIYQEQEELYLVNDAAAQKEVYYDLDFTTFASQVKLVETVVAGEEHEDVLARNYYNSPSFLNKKLFVAHLTHRQNIKHLISNHYLDLKAKKVIRFFPFAPLKKQSLSAAANKAVTMLKGYLKAASLRYPLAIAITSGYDSRVLFLASRGTNSTYFVFQHANMSDTHVDVVIPQQLTQWFKVPFRVIKDLTTTLSAAEQKIVEQSIDFPRTHPVSSQPMIDKMHINGNVSEVARNLYGYNENMTGKELAVLTGHGKEAYVAQVYQTWKDENQANFKKNGFHLLDMFYWEGRIPTWAAKAKTEATLDREMFSPFNSRELLLELMSTDRKQRDNHSNQLYDEIIRILDPEALRFPINPDRTHRMIRLMKKLGIYNFYQKWKIRRKA